MLGVSTFSYSWVWECENKAGDKMSLRSTSEKLNDVFIQSGVLSGNFRVKNFWDGHNNGIMTGDKISIYYASPYGRIENVDVVADLDDHPTEWVKKIHFSFCNINWNNNLTASEN